MSNFASARHGQAGRRQSGFTLIELMIVVLVLAVLMAIAYPSYNQYTIKTRRNTAASCLQERAQLLERYYTTHLTYVGAPNLAQCDGVENFYTIGWEENPTARAFKIRAVPQGVQEADTKCGTLSLDESGARTVSGSSTAQECW